ncbi:hypothetical protein FRC12_020239 [Ceratobasidium sp. 428]|nr:hypothetical protein FRC12_020239 [Ceratobasidium sp. 428]
MDTGAIAVDLSDFHFLFEGVPIDILLLGEMFSCSNQFQLRTVLYAIQSLNTLKVENWIIDQEFCEIFTRVESHVHVSGLSAPKIRNLHLTNAKIVDQQGLKDLVLSHGLEQMLLGGYLSHGSGLEADWQPLMVWEELVEWLAENVPAIQLVLGGDYRSPEFQIAK